MTADTRLIDYTNTLNASSARLQHVNDVLRPELIKAQRAAVNVADQVLPA